MIHLLDWEVDLGFGRFSIACVMARRAVAKVPSHWQCYFLPFMLELLGPIAGMSREGK